MTIAAVSNSGVLESVASPSTPAPLVSAATSSTGQELESLSTNAASANSDLAQLAVYTYTPSQTAATSSSTAAAASASQAGPETTLSGQTLAQSQTISADLDVRSALLFAGGFYITPTDQAWSDLTQSLASGNVTAAQTALATYTQALPTAPEALSPLTAPSTQFLSDLTALGMHFNPGT